MGNCIKTNMNNRVSVTKVELIASNEPVLMRNLDASDYKPTFTHVENSVTLLRKHTNHYRHNPVDDDNIEVMESYR